MSKAELKEELKWIEKRKELVKKLIKEKEEVSNDTKTKN